MREGRQKTVYKQKIPVSGIFLFMFLSDPHVKPSPAFRADHGVLPLFYGELHDGTAVRAFAVACGFAVADSVTLENQP